MYLGIDAVGGRWGDRVDVIIVEFAPVVGGVKFLSELVEYLCRYGGNIANILPLKIARQKIIDSYSM